MAASFETYSVNNQPPLAFVSNNGKGKDLLCLNYLFQKSKHDCSISIKNGPEGPSEPIIATYLNIEHSHEPVNPNDFTKKQFYDEVKS